MHLSGEGFNLHPPKREHMPLISFSVVFLSLQLENFPVASPLDGSLPVVCQSSSSSSSSYPFRIGIPCSIFRGSGLSTYVEFEVKVLVHVNVTNM